MSQFYNIDLDDPESPQLLEEYKNLRPGDHVVYQYPPWRQPDGTYKTGGMDPPLVITEILYWPTHETMPQVQAILNEGEWEVNADNLALEKSEGSGGPAE